MASKAGRKTVMTEKVLGKLEHAFSLGLSDKKACLYAGIHVDTLYSYEQKNPEFSERKKRLKMNPVMKARETIFKHLNKPKIAMWYLERTCPDEFHPRYAKTAFAREQDESPFLTAEEIEQLKEAGADVEDIEIVDDEDEKLVSTY